MDETNNTTGQAPSGSNALTMQRPLIVALLYLLNIFLGFSVFIGLILAYIWRAEDQAQEWERTHYTYLIRTFWIGAGVMVWIATAFGIASSQAVENDSIPVGFLVVFFGGGALFMLTAVWFCVRAVLSIVKSGNREAMPNPQTWLF
mgnify:CR=1 FL=1